MTNLTFTKEGEMYKTSFLSTGDTATVQLLREKPGDLIFKVSIGNMKPMPIKVYNRYNAGVDFITSINVPNGTLITIESGSAVIEGGYES